MPGILKELKPVYVVGVGWHRYQNPSDTTYVTLGLEAIRMALSDAEVDWQDVDSTFFATGLLGMAAGRAMLRHLGTNGKPISHIENASASGSTAFRHACMEIGAGISDVSLVVGVDKREPVMRAYDKAGVVGLADEAISPPTHFALLTNRYASAHGVSPEDVAYVALKNHRNGSKNPFAQRQKERSIEEILGGRPVAGTLTALQCCPVGEGAAAVILASESGIKRLGLDANRAIRVSASAASSESAGQGAGADATITTATMNEALRQAQVKATNVDVLELHDAFTIEELLYTEGLGLCGPGQAIHMLKEGAFDIGGQMAVSPSGGLIAMGHPIGPTGVGQIGEITMQLRGEAGARQHKGAKIGMAHMVGLGAVCYVHLLQKN